MASLFGFQFRRDPKEDKKNNQSFTAPINDDGAVVVAAGGAYGTFVDLEGSARTEAELVTKYREMSLTSELDMAIEEIVNEAMCFEPEDPVVQINLDELPVEENIKQLMVDEFKRILQLFEFTSQSYDLFRRWYVDGRMFFHVVIDPEAPQKGIKELRYIDPRKIRKVREVRRVPIPGTAATTQQTASEYYIFNERGFQNALAAVSTTVGTTGIKIAADSIIHVTSGVMDKNNQLVLSHLHKAIKPLNQLRAIEDSSIIYRISRAPERRVFYIDVGNLPKMKAEQYLRDIMTRFKNRVVYDSSTGEIRDDRKFMTMLEDFWLPRREGGQGTKIETLPAGQNLGQIEDIEYFQKNLYRSVNVPLTRLDPTRSFSIGRATEITREEVKFAKFINRLQVKFSSLFLYALEKQLILKKIITPEDWPLFSNVIKFKFGKDNNFAELKDLEVLQDRLNGLQSVQPYIGTFFSKEWVRKNILRQTDEEITEIESQIQDEITTGQLASPEEQPEQSPEPVQG